ncbi:MAG: tRNA (adenosine(37)-N6)-threonylcarbamoyltransferase complex ATPase subunit type 1 TsaE [Spirosomataceae bacterium]
MIFYAKNIVELKNVAQQLLATVKQNNIWIFEGEMGAGKTTLIKEICKSLRVLGNVQSPTFSIVNEYLTENEETIYHFDFYRLENETEALDIGIEEYFYSGDLCLIEWAEKIPNLIPKKFIKIKISVLEDETRKIELTLN